MRPKHSDILQLNAADIMLLPTLDDEVAPLVRSRPRYTCSQHQHLVDCHSWRVIGAVQKRIVVDTSCKDTTRVQPARCIQILMQLLTQQPNAYLMAEVKHQLQKSCGRTLNCFLRLGQGLTLQV